MASSDVSEKLGEYMLKGWVLTDTPCPNLRCIVPLLRSPKLPSTHFCARCDEEPARTRSRAESPPPLVIQQHAPTRSISSSSHVSRTSTPPTDVSSTLSSPVFAPPIDTDDHLRRRQQSDTASMEIGKRLLKGWAMLAEECPNSRCYGVPLVRPPKPGGGKDPRKECVICGTVYVSDDSSGWDRLVAFEPGLYTADASPPANRAKGKRTAGVRDDTSLIVQEYDSMSPSAKQSSAPPDMPATAHPQEDQNVNGHAKSALEASSQSLENSLRALSGELDHLSNARAIDCRSIGNTADAILKVTLALSQVKRLQPKSGV